MSRCVAPLRLPVLLGALGLLAGCAEGYQEALPNGDYLVTHYSRLGGISATRYANREAALATCPDGYILLEESFGQDDNGVFRRWTYGCIER